MLSEAVHKATRGRFYYGWVIVALIFLVHFGGGGLGGYVLMVLIKPISDEMHWTRSSIIGASSFSSLLAAALAPIIGPLIDKYGTRGFIVWGAFAQGVILMMLSRVTDLWQLYVLYGLGGALAQAEMTGTAPQAAIANWFIRNRGRAMAFSMIGISLSGTIFAPLTQVIASTWGWRTTWVVKAVIIWAVILLPVWFLMRRRPEDMGLRPDGAPPAPKVGEIQSRASIASPPRKEEVNITLGEALRGRSFWLLTVFSVLFSFPLIGVFLNLPSYFSDIGFSPAVAATAMGAYAFATFVARLFWGIMSERFPIRYLFTILVFLAAGVLSLILAMSSFKFMLEVWILFPLATLMGFLAGGSTILRGILWPDYYGRLHIGAIRGVGHPFEAVASAVGPVFAAFLFDSTGSYQTSFRIFIAMYVISGFLMFSAKPPVEKTKVPAEERVSPALTHGS